MSTKAKVMARALRLVESEGLDINAAISRAMAEFGIDDYSIEPTPDSPQFQGMKPMSLDELLEHKQKSQPKPKAKG